jgi:uncharacterized membrane protein YciS (DUF1049 family)
LQRLLLLAQRLAVELQALVVGARKRTLIAFNLAYLHRQQREQIAFLVSLVRTLHQFGLARALGRIGLAVGVQGARELAVDLAN